MINQINLLNFQSHKDTLLEFSAGFNLLIGASDNGKSSILRAIEWLRTNRPKGTSFIRKGSNQAEIAIEIDDNIIERMRTHTDTGCYVVNDEEFSKGDVPDEVERVLQLQDINVQLQLDSHFLILESPGNVSRSLNNITKLDKLTEAVGELKKRLLKVNREVQTTKENIEEIESYLKSGIQDDLADLVEIENEIQEIEKEYENLTNKLSACKSLVSSIERNRRLLADKDKIEEAAGLLTEIYDKYNELEKFENDYKTKKNVVFSLERYYIIITTEKEKLVELEKERNELLNKLEVCPFCGQEIDDKVRRRLK